MSLFYTSKKGYSYKQINNTVVRVSSKESHKYKPIKPSIGDKVKIIIKPYNQKKHITGIIKRVLTSKQFHSRGHKVMLQNGTVGRVIKTIN
jgi:uncharacterized repeat protein (TIGR03833 family)